MCVHSPGWVVLNTPEHPLRRLCVTQQKETRYTHYTYKVYTLGETDGPHPSCPAPSRGFHLFLVNRTTSLDDAPSIETAVEPGKVSLTQLSGYRRFADERIIICDVVSQGREINK